MLEFIILGVLKSGKKSGYDIRKCIDYGIGMFYKASFGSLYPLLNRLLEKKLVNCMEFLENNRRKKVYEITDAGRHEFEKWLLQGDITGDTVDAFMARVYFYDQLPTELRREKMRSFRVGLEKHLSGLLEKREKFLEIRQSKEYYCKVSTLYYGICKLQSVIAWCQAVEHEDDLEKIIGTYGSVERGNYAGNNQN